MMLRGHQHQARARFLGTPLRGERIQDAEDRGIRREDTNSNREHHCEAKDDRHEERNHGQPTFFNFDRP